MSLYVQLPPTIKALADNANVEPEILNIISQIKSSEGELYVQLPPTIKALADNANVEPEVSLVGFSSAYEVEFPPF